MMATTNIMPETCDCCVTMKEDTKCTLGADKIVQNQDEHERLSTTVETKPLTSIILQLKEELQDVKKNLKEYEDLKMKHAELQLELDITKSQLQRFQRNEMDLLAVRREIALQNLRRHHNDNTESDFNNVVCRCPGGGEILLEDSEDDYDTID